MHTKDPNYIFIESLCIEQHLSYHLLTISHELCFGYFTATGLVDAFEKDFKLVAAWLEVPILRFQKLFDQFLGLATGQLSQLIEIMLIEQVVHHFF